ncbi:MAG: polysaccharide biosynthesis tyrosine autokinase [Lachnospiraceae bacterium]
MQENNREQSSINIEKINYYSIFRDVLRNWWVILLGAIAAAMIGHIVANEQYYTTYTTSATFVVSSRGSDNNVYNNLSSAQTLATTFSNVLNSSIVKKKVCEDLGLSTFSAQASAEVISETNLLVLTVTADTPEMAYRIIRSIMENYTTVSSAVLGNAMMEVLQEPPIPQSPDTSLGTRQMEKKGFLWGMILCTAMFAVLSFLNDTIKSDRDLADKLDAKPLGTIYFEKKYKTLFSRIRHKKTSILVTNPTASFWFTESYKKIAAKLTYMAAETDGKVIVVTSIAENEGKSTVAANLALTLAKNPAKVLLIDCDLRRPSQHLIFDKKVDKEKTLPNLLNHECTLKEVFQYDKERGIYTLFTGKSYANSTEIISSEEMRNVLKVFRKAFDYIILDSPPMSLMADAEALADQADMSVLVVRYSMVQAQDINDAIDALSNCNSRMAGCILNQARTMQDLLPGKGGYGYGKYRYGYGKYGKYGKTE